jgi:hypothetical protein
MAWLETTTIIIAKKDGHMTDDELRQAIRAYRKQGQTRSHIFEMLKPPGGITDEYSAIFEQEWPAVSALRETPQQTPVIIEDNLKRD